MFESCRPDQYFLARQRGGKHADSSKKIASCGTYMKPNPPHAMRRRDNPLKGTSRLALTILLLVIRVSAGTAATGHRAFDVTFIEQQWRTNYIPADPRYRVDPLFFSQDNRIALTLRDDHVDYEHERNFGAIYQYNVKPKDKNGRIVEEGGTGAFGAWFRLMPGPDTFQNAQVRVWSQGGLIYVQFHGSNYTQLLKIAADQTKCSAKIVYWPDDGEKVFKMVSMQNGQLDRVADLTAANVRCSIGNGDLF